MDKIEQLGAWIQVCDNIVFFGGAGVSTESGIPDFRSTDGLYHQTYRYPPETILSHRFFMSHTKDFYAFYRDKMLYGGVKPNKAHLFLASLEKAGKCKAVVTQNIDGLHQLAGSRNVLELHGSVLRNFCMKCGKFYGMEAVRDSLDVPLCTCGGVIKPDVVLYEEPLNEKVLEDAVRYISEAQMLVIGGTSLNVYPAAGLIRYFQGKYLVLINKSETQADAMANLVFHEPIGEVFSKISL